MSGDIKNYCRVCLDVRNDHVSILQDPVINLHLKSCLSITVSPNDQLPKEICLSCVSQLSDFYSFQLNAKCSQDWLESATAESKKSIEAKLPIQPLPDSEYNSDSLLEFLNNTANIEEYLNNLGKDDIPTIVGMFDKSNEPLELQRTKKSKVVDKSDFLNSSMEIDVLDSDIEIVKDLLMKETDPKVRKTNNRTTDKSFYSCFACKVEYTTIGSLTQHLSTCDIAVRTCVHCLSIFNSKKQMLQHYVTHTSYPFTCTCGRQFDMKEKLLHHAKSCNLHMGRTNCVYKCKQCGIIYKDRLQLYKHIKQHLRNSIDKTCDICGHKFVSEDTLRVHKRDVHDKGTHYKYRCKVCCFTSDNHEQVYQHVKRHLSREHHLCETCGCSFSTLTTLKRHSLTHRGKEYSCSICCKKFESSRAREEHAQNHDKVMCEKCGDSVALDQHEC